MPPHSAQAPDPPQSDSGGRPEHAERPTASWGWELSYVPGLDGVRAVAITGVLLYHGGIPGVSGGFLGVDCFFVLSGYLITTLLLAEWGSKGGIALGGFWARRARRLLPALIVMVVAVCIAARFLSPGSGPALRADAFWTLFYGANWHFIFSGSGYFAASTMTSPLKHTWSLAIEEQFYLVWPLVVLGVLRLTRRLGALLTVAVIGAAASAADMALRYRAGVNLNALYYGTDTRAQAILVGASLAIALVMASSRPARRQGGTTSRVLLGLLGLAGLAGTLVLWHVATGSGAFLYEGGFAVAALCAAAVVWSVVGATSWVVARVLSLGPLRYLGQISYGVYLWHFPIFLWVDGARTGLGTLGLFAVRLSLTLAVAACSFHFLELPVRRGALLRGLRVWLVTPAIVSAALVAALVLTNPPPSSALPLSPRPDVRPPLTPTTLAAPTETLLMVGDSMSWSLANGWVGSVGHAYGLNILNEATPNCALTMGEVQLQDNPPQAQAPPCEPSSGSAEWPLAWALDVDRYHPAVSVLLTRLDIVNHLYDGTVTNLTQPSFAAYLHAQIELAAQILISRGGRAVFLTTPYYDSGEQPDGAPWPEDEPSRAAIYNAMLEAVAAQYPGRVYVIDLNRIACPNGMFQTDVDGVDLRFTDGIHWTYQGDWWLAPQLLPPIYDIGRGLEGTGTMVAADPPLASSG